MYYQTQEEHHDHRQQPPGVQPQFFPGFPIPGFPGADLNQRVRVLEGEVARLQRQVNQLDRRVARLEGGGFYPWGATRE
ncbi:hypothetical protein [Caldalkalibacillus mannanilyticus]|uniref:hypothetical protein n=1 Tax=Caldalkalibacillus mannanilyticus TaxID=1418 RepID=UPI000467F329|nr:hypothetical protein [Caldalkalibacillus mannanilyticus]